ncbi:hypothetical protein SISSUDRAFT_1049430 [Sistotremastrum suecicum HHB10207 ss-3]|uniref:Sacsin/Nov domain-containing protein n=1 Tax=Sistotremastrum suecicum HHB10207 ss-3 TaxID=1314776 RepID=A0A166BV55_9AGAM|nr:hypothetical protein SISSUDRAFT_1049430 [Sistotremastrum suecicum HHB10207 ss-3]
MDVIKEIRRKKGYDEEMMRNADPHMVEWLTDTRANLHRSIEKLAVEIYSKSTHFIFELIQNADDSKYTNEVPTLYFKLREDQLITECNEEGFTAEDVKSICNSGDSTKSGKIGYIGEKGIGFKSVFQVSDVVHICSREFMFKFDATQTCGMLTPIWDPLAEHERTNLTRFTLDLKANVDRDALASELMTLSPSLLLFLRQLRSITLDVKLRSGKLSRVTLRHITGEDRSIVILEKKTSSMLETQKYYVIKKVVPTHPGEKRRANVRESEIVLAFPVASDLTPKISSQAVHAFLPLRDYGFSFVIQADFLASANREDLLTDLSWNKQLRSGITATFSQAVEDFKARSQLQYTWVRFLPSSIFDPFFSGLETSIIEDLKQRPIILDSMGVYHRPRDVLIAPSRFRDERGQPLLEPAFLPKPFVYLSSSYMEKDHVHLRRLGVRSIDEDLFVQGLALMLVSLDPSSRTDGWHEAVCQALYSIRSQIPVKKRRSYDYETTWPSHEVRALRLLPMKDGRWVPANSITDVYFDSALSNIPANLGIHLLNPGIEPNTWRHCLYAALGVKVANEENIAAQILKRHSTGEPNLIRMDDMISDALWFFESQYCPSSTGIKLRVVTDSLESAWANTVYVDYQDSSYSIKLHGILKAPFLHSAYFRKCQTPEQLAKFVEWLRLRLGLHICPRLIDGQLSPEFKALCLSLNMQDLLCVIQQSWTSWSNSDLGPSAIAYLGNLTTTCQDGKSYCIKDTYLGTTHLKQFDGLPFLSVKDAENPEWMFLERLGVSTKLDGALYLRLLRRLKDQGSHDEEQIQSLYQSLQNHFVDAPEAIKQAFASEPLVYLKNKHSWVTTCKVVWKGARSMTSKVALEKMYQGLSKLMRDLLNIQDCGPDLLVEELQLISETWRNQQIPKEQSQAISDKLIDLCDFLDGQEYSGDAAIAWLQRLASLPIFPVDSPSHGMTLRAIGEKIYVADPTGHLSSIFRSKVEILSFNNTTILHIQRLLKSPVFKSHVRTLEDSVVRASVPAGRATTEAAEARKIQYRANFVKSYIQGTFPNKCNDEVLQLLDNLQNVSIQLVPDIQSTYTLQDITQVTTDEIVLVRKDTELTIFTSLAPSTRRNLKISNEFANLLPIETHMFHVCIYQDLELVEGLFNMKGIEVPALQNVDQHIEAMLVDEDRHIEAMLVDEALLHTQHYSPSRKAPRLYAPRHTQALVVTDNDRDGGNDHVKYLSGVERAAQNVTTLGSVIQSRLAVPQAHDPSSGSQRGPSTRTDRSAPSNTQLLELTHAASGFQDSAAFSPDLDIATISGICGEYFIYKVFSNVLPGFDASHWTSDIKGKIPGMAPHGTTAPADFEYRDAHGVLTRHIFGQEIMDAWKDRWPTYYMEVKATTQDLQEKLSMSKAQVQFASQCTLSRAGDPPGAIYILIRVWKVLRDPQWKLYVDPHTLLYTGELEIVSPNLELKPVSAL